MKFSLGSAVIAAASLTGILALSACEEHPYPTASRQYEQPSPPPPPAALAGAPSSTPAPAPAYAPPAPQSQYDGGSVVAMAPIPNPGDPGSESYYTGGHYVGGARVHSRLYTTPNSAPIAQHSTPRTYAAAPHPAHIAPVKVNHSAVPPIVVAKVAPPHPVASVGASAKAAGAVALTAAAVAGHNLADTANAAAKPAASEHKPDHAAALASLQASLTDTVSKTAVLAAPDHFVTNKPTDVTLTIPKAFADTVKGEANKDGLTDAVASVNMSGQLSGPGYVVTPEATQLQPLVADQDTVLRWTVTALADAKGPLHADVGATLLGGGQDSIALGSVQKHGSQGLSLNGRFVGASILVLLAALIVAWLARGRGSARPATIRSRDTGSPFDMGSGGPNIRS